MRRIIGFTVVSAMLMALLLLVMHVMFPLEVSRRAFRVSAAIALAVQVAGFVIARAVAKENVMAGWGLAVLLRFAVVFAFAFAAPGLGLPLGAALTSLVAFLFVSTLIEPIFLKP